MRIALLSLLPLVVTIARLVNLTLPAVIEGGLVEKYEVTKYRDLRLLNSVCAVSLGRLLNPHRSKGHTSDISLTSGHFLALTALAFISVATLYPDSSLDMSKCQLHWSLLCIDVECGKSINCLLVRLC